MKHVVNPLILALLAFAGCAAAPNSATPRAQATEPASVQRARTQDRAARPISLVSYAQSGSVTVVSSTPPSVERLASGRWLVTFSPEPQAVAVNASPALPAK